MVASACYSSTPGVFAFKHGKDIFSSWRKHAIIEGVFAEGISAGDLDGDGKVEIVCGPYWYKAPEKGPYDGPWERKVYAPNFREMCRTLMSDITGNGRPDIIITDSEYMDGYLSWFENRLLEDPKNPWVEHRLDEDLVYSHSLDARLSNDKKVLQIFVGEMAQGGWNAPYNHNARLIIYSTKDRGKTWDREVFCDGEGMHQSHLCDIDGDGEYEVVGKTWGLYQRNPKLKIWKRKDSPILSARARHTFVDRDKPYTGIEIFPADIDGDNLEDIVCGAWWYKNPSWKRYAIPGIAQAILAYDIDKDGRKEIIGIKGRKDDYKGDFYGNLTSELCWLKPIDPLKGKWEEHFIGSGAGDWPHGSVIAPFLPGGKLALVTSYHGSSNSKFPEIFEVPASLGEPWKKRVIAEIDYNEEIIAADIDGDGKLDIVAGMHWLKNMGDGTFKTHKITDDDFQAARIAVLDVNGNGRLDVILGEEVMDYPKKEVPFSRLAWFENPGKPTKEAWKMHVIDTVRCAHSVLAADIDGDGETEIICGEHYPFWPYRSRCRLIAYKKADKHGKTWKRYVLDNRFEHHDGTKIIKLSDKRCGIISHGWQDGIYVNLWEIV
jgi:hypothetical protein